MPQNTASDRGLHCLITEYSIIEISIKLKISPKTFTLVMGYPIIKIEKSTQQLSLDVKFIC